MDEEALFVAALERPAGPERRAFLEEACGGDLALLRRVERLLAAHAQTPGILDGSAVGPEWTRVLGEPAPGVAPAGERAGSVIAGRYRLVEKVGEGGMGTVWLAEQVLPVRRQVALKLIKPGMDSRTVLARFEAERQALALMEHPNIARVFDGGTTAAGRPFFAMEYVPGVPLTDYCDAARLGIDERLELFVATCQAVQHAHAKGVIHRDLKPGNILVGLHDGQPVPKVIDFGIAKAVQDPLSDQTLLTAHGGPVGTPMYMSPEQAEPHRRDVDTRADVYALGVILYELLTGTTPLERRHFRAAGWGEVLRLIQEQEPPRPSVRLGGSDALPSLAARRRLEPARLARLLRGELDWIVMKCLEKERSRRYETASGLARDVRRYLADESVEACPPSFGYRLGKFLRRHRGPVLAASLVALLLVGGIAGTTWGLVRAEHAREAEAARAEGERLANARAQERIRQVEALIETLAAVFDNLDPHSAEREDKPLAAVLGDQLSRVAGQIEGLEVGDPRLAASLQDRLGLALYRLGQAGRAAGLFEKSRGLRAAALGAEDPLTLASANHLATSLNDMGQHARAVALHEETLRIRRAKLGPDHPETLVSMLNLGLACQKAGDRRRAVATLEAAAARWQATQPPGHRNAVDTREALAGAYRAEGDPRRAIPILEEVVAARRAGPDGPEGLRTLESMSILASTYKEARQPGRAVPLLEEALRLTRARVGPDHSSTLIIMNNLALAYRAADQPDRALPLLERTLELRRARHGPEDPLTLHAMNNLGTLYHFLRDMGRAVPLLEDALRIRKLRLPADHPDLIVSTNNLAQAYRDAGRRDAALPLLEESLRLIRGKFDPGHPTTIIALLNLSSAYRDAGSTDAALPLAREAAEAVERRRFEHLAAERVVDNLGEILERSGRPAEAEPWRRKWLSIAAERSGPASPPHAAALEALGANLLLQERWPDAEAALREALAAREAAEPDGREASGCRSRLGGALLGRGKFAEAEPVLLRAYRGLQARGGPEPAARQAQVAEAGGRIVRLYEGWGRPEQAAEWRAKVAAP